MSTYKIFLFFYLIFFHCELIAQGNFEQFNVTNYTVEDGLPSNELYDVHQDSLGNLWLASDHGLVKFDGQKMQTYGLEDGLPDEVILKIYEDDKHRMWLLTYTGGVCYMEKGKFIIPSFNNRLLKLLPRKQSFVNKIAVVHDEVYLWCTDCSSSYFKALVGGRIEKVELTELYKKLDTKNPNVRWILELENEESLMGVYISDTAVKSNMLIPEDTGLWYKEEKHAGKKITFYHLNGWGKGYHGTHWRSEQVDILMHEGKALSRDSSGMSFVFDFKSRVFDAEKSQAGYFFPLFNGGLLQFKNKLDSVNLVGHYLKQYMFTSICKDRQGRLWVSTQNNGLLRISSLEQGMFQITEKHPGVSMANPVHLKQDTLKYIKGQVLYVHPIKEGELINPKQYFLKGPDIFTNSLERVVWLPDGSFFYHFLHFKIRPKDNDTLQGVSWAPPRNGYIQKLYSGKTGTEVLGATNFGFFLLDSTGFQFDSEKVGFRAKVYCLVRKNEDEFLLGTQNGLIYYNKATHQWRKSDASVLQSPIKDIAQDQYGRVWIIPKGQGVVILDRDSIFRITKKEHLSSDVCHSLLIDSNEAWIGTNNGLNLLRFNQRGITETTFLGPREGLFLDYIDHVVKDGSSIFAFSGKKFARLKTSLPSSGIPPVSIIEKIEVGDTNYSIPHLNAFQPKAGDNHISFHYRVNTLLDSKLIWYKYRLLGKENTWTYGHERVACFHDLEPGHYTFQLMSRNAQGIWSKAPLEYSFFIPKHLHERWWFRITSFVLTVLLFVFLAEQYRKNQQKKLFVKHQLLRSGINALKAQMNPHFIFNALNSVRHLLLYKKNNEADVYLSKFSGLLRGLLNDMEQGKTSLATELKMIRNYLQLEEMRMGNAFNWEITLQDGLKPDELLIPPMLIQPLLENAIWHGLNTSKKEGKISVHFYLKDKILYGIICDNGEGFNPKVARKTKSSGNGLGLKNIKERLALLREFDGKPYAIQIESEPNGTGTTIKLSIPQ